MAFVPRRLGDGRICCSSPHALCDKCRARLRAASQHEREPQLRTLSGKRNSSSDQEHLDAIHRHAVMAGATCPDADEDDGAGSETDPLAASQRLLRTAEGGMRLCAKHRVELRGYGSVVTSTPDPYRAATEHAAGRALTPDLDSTYRPHGKPPNGYAIALASRFAKQNPNASQHPASRPVVTTNGVPDGYLTALSRRKDIELIST
jgi:hypothetical protein